MNLHSSLKIEVLLHYYCSSKPHPDCNTPGVIEIIKSLRKEGIFTDQVQPALTDKGKAWVKLILNTPYPEQVFVDQNKNIISIDE